MLTVLSTVLKKAVEWGELERVPCTIKLLANPRRAMAFLDFEEYERLLDGSQTRCPDTYLMAPLGGEAGRSGSGRWWRSNGRMLTCRRDN